MRTLLLFLVLVTATYASALSDAYALVKDRQELHVIQPKESMQPYFNAGDVLVVKRISEESLKTGMLAVYANAQDEITIDRIEDGKKRPLNIQGVVYVTLRNT
jgi:signal peptidase I